MPRDSLDERQLVARQDRLLSLADCSVRLNAVRQARLMHATACASGPSSCSRLRVRRISHDHRPRGSERARASSPSWGWPASHRDPPERTGSDSCPDRSPRRRGTTRKRWGASGAAPSRSGWTTASTARWRTWPAPTATRTATRPPNPTAPGRDKGPVTCIAAGHGPSSTRGMGDSNPRGLSPNTLSKRAP